MGEITSRVDGRNFTKGLNEPKEKAIKRFENFLEPVPEAGCWIWTGSKQYSGYGAFKYLRKRRDVHRLAWEFYRGEIPVGAYVLHKCDNKLCCNPSHLYLGDQVDNMRDYHSRKRK